MSAVTGLDQAKLSRMLAATEQENLQLSQKELASLNELVVLFEQFWEVTDDMQSDKMVNIIEVVPSILSLYRHLYNMTAKFCQPITDELMVSPKKGFSGIFKRVKMLNGDVTDKDGFGDPLYLIAAALDPEWGLL